LTKKYIIMLCLLYLKYTNKIIYKYKMIYLKHTSRRVGGLAIINGAASGPTVNASCCTAKN
jgi:hypothetical protein